MRTALLLSTLIAVACSSVRPASTPPPPPLVVGRSVAEGGAVDRSGVRFSHPPARVGERWRVSLRAESLADTSPPQTTIYESEIGVEVLAVDGPAPSRLRVHVDRNVNTYQDHVAPTSVDGKDYVVDVKEPHVRDASGAPAPQAEADRVLAWFPDLGSRTRLDEILPDESMRVGEPRDELAAAILRVLHPTAWKLDEGHATLARADAKAAEFDVTIATTSALGMTMALAGTAKVRLADAFLVDLTMRGTYTSGSDTGRFEVKRTVSAEP